ncbi:MAG: hypothetical protein AB7R89_26200 [Dehalococcoidia bacterium]
MERPFRTRPSGASSALLAGGIGVFALLAYSLTLQAPYDAGADTLQRTLGWARAGLLTAGAATFLIGLAVSLRSDDAPLARWASFGRSGVRTLDSAAFTVVALGDTPDDARAIADAGSAEEAIALLWQWSDRYPDEHVVVFDADAEPMAFKRPVYPSSAMRQGAA